MQLEIVVCCCALRVKGQADDVNMMCNVSLLLRSGLRCETSMRVFDSGNIVECRRKAKLHNFTQQ